MSRGLVSRTQRVARGVAAAGIAGGLLLTLGTGCGEEEKGGEGDECSVSADCQSPLVCRDSVCVAPGGGGGDTGMVDGGDAGMTDGGSTKPMEEDYYVSFELRDKSADPKPGRLMLYSTADGSITQVSPDGVNCFSNCWLSEDGSKFIYTERSGSGFDVFVSDVGEDMQAEEAKQAFLTSVGDVAVVGNYISYNKQNGDSKIGYFTPIGEKKETQVVPYADDWFIDPQTKRVVTYEVGSASQSLTVRAGDVSNIKDAPEVTLGGPNFQSESGSHYGSTYVSSISRDGKVLAFLTPSQPNDYAPCTREKPQQPYSSKDCEPSFKCGTQNRCVRKEVTVNFIDLENADNLGTRCSAPGSCGPVHKCDIPSPRRVDEARCIPGRRVLGLPASVPQDADNTTGCELVAADDSIDFTGVNAPLSWDTEGNLYMVGVRRRGCLGDYQVPASHLVKINPSEDGYEKFGGLPVDKKFRQCWSNEEMGLALSPEVCKVYIDSAQVSPGGNELAFSATHPLTSTPGQAKTLRYLWRMLRDGTGRKFVGDENTDATQEVTNIEVHQMN